METKTYRVILTKEAVYYVDATSEMEAQQQAINTTLDGDYELTDSSAEVVNVDNR